MHLENEQAGDREDQCGAREDVDEPAPRGTGVAAPVEVVEVGEPAAVGALVLDLAVGQAQAQPGVAARAGEREINFVVRPLGLAARGTDVPVLLHPGLQFGGQGRLSLEGLGGWQLLFELRAQDFIDRTAQLRDGRPGLDLPRVIEREARDAEQDHANQADRRAHPMPFVQGLEPVGSSAGVGAGGSHHRRRGFYPCK
jgi:hypothetical protein